MILKKILLFSAVAIFSTSIFLQSAGAQESQNNVVNSVDLQDSIKFRTIFGLNSDRNYVSEVIKGQEKSKLHGVALTKQEEKELNQRFELQRENKPKILKELRQDPSFAWLYIDQQHGGMVNIGFKEKLTNKSDTIEFIKKLYGAPEKVKFVQAKFSEQELNQLAENIFKQGASVKSETGVTINKTATNIINEKVDVYITPYSNDSIDKLNRKFPLEMVTYHAAEKTQLEASRSDKIRPLQGGIQIVNNDVTTNKYSTAGFIAHNSSGNYYLVTTGHSGSVNDSFSQGGSFIGLMAGSNVSGTNDSGIISIPSSLASKKVYGNTSGDITLTSAQASNSDNVGDRVCISGAVSGYNCGVITNVDVYDNIAGYVMNHVRAATYTSATGDSGSVIFDGSVLKGVHFGSSGSTRYFSHVSAVLNQWGLTF